MKRTEAKHVEDFKRTATTEHARTVRDYITRLEKENAHLSRVSSNHRQEGYDVGYDDGYAARRTE